MDKDIRMAIFFLTNLATILEFMQQKISYGQDSEIDVEYYKNKMNNYEVVFDAVIEDFINSMFGQFANSASKADFQLNLMSDGWKFFDLLNLNELFHIKFLEKKEEGLIEEQEGQTDDQAGLSIASMHLQS